MLLRNPSVGTKRFIYTNQASHQGTEMVLRRTTMKTIAIAGEFTLKDITSVS